MTDEQKAALNGLEMLKTGTFPMTGWDIENIYPRVKMLLFRISQGDLVCVEKSAYAALIKPKRKSRS